MTSIKPTEMTERDNYKFLIGSIIPRPIAVITSLSTEGVLNIAPFSYFNIVTSAPPIVSVSIQRKNGALKDTARNLLSRQEGVIHIADEANIVAINQTAANLEPHESELSLTNFTTSPSEVVSVPYLNELKVKLEVSLYQHVPIIVAGEPTADLFLLKVEQYHIDDTIYQAGRIDPQGLQPLSRLAGHDYAALGAQTTLARPE